MATTCSNLLSAQGCFKLHQLVIFQRKSDGYMFPRCTTFLCLWVLPGCRAGLGATKHILYGSVRSTNPSCSDRLTETTVSVLYFISKLDQHQEDLSCREIKKRPLPLCFFLSLVGHVLAQTKTCPILYNSVQSRLERY